MFDSIISALRATEGAHDWLVQHVRKNSTQLYVIGGRAESSRRVTAERYAVTVMNDHPAARDQNAEARGEADVSLLPGDLPLLQSKLNQAVFMATLTDNVPYGLPGPAEYPAVAVSDPEIQTAPWELAERTVHQLLDSLRHESHVRLSSAEVFVDESHITLQNSRGAAGSKVETDVLLDFVLLATNKNDEMESHIALERRRAADLDVPLVAQRQAQFARDALAASTPHTGTFPVVVSDEALAELLMSGGDSPLLFRSSAQAKYQQMTPWEIDSSVLLEPPTGDPITLYSNSLLAYGARSASFDREGHPGQRVLIIDNGVLRAFWAPMRYAQYLNVPATGHFGNMELAAGSQPVKNLLQGDGPFYHILAFSAMSPDPITGDFVGEIRLGYEVEHGSSRPVKGGSISGNLFSVLAAAQLSRETVMLGDYQGPRAMRFAAITIAGA
jgi:PmbA protein